ncbi:MAG TPA: hypothetical protein VF955_01950 [Pyrinomonadaceae bacterium]
MKGKTAESKAAEDANEYRELLNQVKIATRVLNQQSVRVGSGEQLPRIC